MDSEGSNIYTAIAAVMAEVNKVAPYWDRPDGPFDQMEVKIGVEEISSQDESPQVYWIPQSDEGYHVATEQPVDGVADYETWTTIQVKCWGKDLDEAVRLRDTVLTRGLRRFGKAFKPVGRGTYSKGISSAERGMMITFAVAFKFMIWGEAWKRVTVSSVGMQTPTTTIRASNGDLLVVDPETGEPTGETFTPPPVPQPVPNGYPDQAVAGAYGEYVSGPLGANSELMQP